MKAVIVYGCPCSGKSTYVRENASERDVIYDFDALLRAVSTIAVHTPDEVAARWPVFKLRRALISACKDEAGIETLYILCRWPSDRLAEELRDIATEYHLVEATREECKERLAKDDMRPDKSAWTDIIDAWFDAHEGQAYAPEKSMHMQRLRLELEKIRF